jgi:hypothetical protein
MKQLNLSSWKELNNSFPRRLIYHAGIDCGFSVELNYMLDAMLYCLANGYRFQLYSDDANFGTGKGWTEYFAPFCEEVHESFHHKYNLHRPPSWRRVIRNVMKTRSLSFVFWKLKFLLKSLIGHWLAYRAYGEYVWLSQDVAHNPDRHYHIPALGINGSYYEAYAMLARMIWHPQPEVQQQIAVTKRYLSLPHVYSGIQIRGGDKAQEARLITGRQIIKALHPQDGECIFALADNYRQLEIVRNEFPHVRILSLCQPDETGYYHQVFTRLSPQEKKESVIRLLASLDILLHSRAFVGTVTSGPSVFLMKVRVDEPCITAIDCPHNMLTHSLVLNIDERAAISANRLR